jgi:DnaJ-class molecular chaperone
MEKVRSSERRIDARPAVARRQSLSGRSSTSTWIEVFAQVTKSTSEERATKRLESNLVMLFLRLSLFYHAEIDLVTALAGGSIIIEHLDDRWLSVDILPGEVVAPGKCCAPL